MQKSRDMGRMQGSVSFHEARCLRRHQCRTIALLIPLLTNMGNLITLALVKHREPCTCWRRGVFTQFRQAFCNTRPYAILGVTTTRRGCIPASIISPRRGRPVYRLAISNRKIASSVGASRVSYPRLYVKYQPPIRCCI